MIKKIALNLLFVFALLFILDFGIGKLLQFFYFRQSSGFQYRTTLAMEKTNADILVFGSSRANHHYSPEIFEKYFHYSFYNAGRDGCSIFYHYAVLKSVLKRYHPKLVILDFSHGEFDKNQDSYDRLSSLLPYYEGHPEIRPILKLKSPNEKIKMISHIYPYNSSVLAIAIGNTEYNKVRWEDNKGYVPLNKELTESIQTDTTTWTKEIDSIKVKMYESFITDCIKSNVKLFIVCSPYFLKFTKSDASVKIGLKIAQKYGVEFYDYSNSSMFSKNSLYFTDRDHLNDTGAKFFSGSVIDSIKL